MDPIWFFVTNGNLKYNIKYLIFVNLYYYSIRVILLRLLQHKQYYDVKQLNKRHYLTIENKRAQFGANWFSSIQIY